jgi:hypothetical protein
LDRPLKRRAGGLFLEAQHQLRQPLNALGLLIGELRQARGDREIGDIRDPPAPRLPRPLATTASPRRFRRAPGTRRGKC